MNRILKVLSIAAFLPVVVAGCSSGRASIEGYEQEKVDGTRIGVLYPRLEQIVMSEPEAFAYSRGVASGGAAEMARDELRGILPAELDARWPRNTVLDYRAQPAGSIVVLTSDVDPTGPNFDLFTSAAREGNFDFFVVLRTLRFDNKAASRPDRVGSERVTAEVVLIDPSARRVVAAGQVEAEVDDPRLPRDTYAALASEIASLMPFSIE